MTADDVADVVTVQAARLKRSSCRAPVTAIRSLFRFLGLCGAVRPGLMGAVPTVRQWKHAALPRPLSAEQVEKVLDQCAEEKPVQRRNRTILLMLARLGLRGGEVAALRLDDIDWRESIIRVRASKSGRDRLLPLSAEVGEVLVGYLTDGRPRSCHRSLFLRSCPPYRGLQPSAVSSIAKVAIERAGISGGPCGSHVLRHTAATLLVRRGVSFKEIADILGHALIETTAIYAKLDIEGLSRVALPWPKEAP